MSTDTQGSLMKVIDVFLPGKAKINPVIFAMIKRSGLSWWQARYSDGKVISEWETSGTKLLLPSAIAAQTSRWEEVPKDNMVGLRLLCPNGMCGELEAPEGYHFIQLKVGRVDVGGRASGRHRLAHIIGVITDIDGACFCRAWESYPGRLIQFYDNVFNMRYENIGRLNLDVQGVKI